MPRSIHWLLITTLLGAAMACSTARNPSKGFRLAGNGDIHRGKAAFLEFKCNTCHEVKGSQMPQPAIRPVSLGGSVIVQPSDGYLVTAIINPSYHATIFPAGERPRMPEYAERMTVQQLTDIVAYLQSRYALRPSAVTPEFP